MKQAQAEIKAIQAKLQAIQAGRSSTRPSPLPPMVELTPNTTPATATMPRQPEQDELAEVAETLHQRSLSYVRHLQQLQPRPQEYPQPLVQPYSQPQSQPPVQPYSQPQSQPPVQPYSQPSPQPPAQPYSPPQRFQSSQPQSQPLSTPPFPPPPQPPRSDQWVADVVKRLEAQVQRINQLSAVQEAALLELKAIAQRAERDRTAAELDQEPTGFAATAALFECLEATVPCVKKGENGAFVLTTRAVDLFKAEREAALNAQALRYRPGKSTGHHTSHYSDSLRQPSRTRDERSIDADGSWTGMLWKQGAAVVQSLSGMTSHRSSSLKRLRNTQAIAMPSVSIQDAVLWVLGSVVVRVGLDLLLLSFPGLWLPVIGVIITPAAIAIYRATVAPQSGLLLGYRLLLVMIGLLLGGRL